MRISNIVAKNFKSFDDVSVTFGDLNVIIGSNASGKSNLVSVLGFVRNLARYGLNDAVSMEGGIEYVRNHQVGTNRNTTIGIEFSSEIMPNLQKSDRLQARSTRYEFSLAQNDDSSMLQSYHVEDEILTIRYDFFKKQRGRPRAGARASDGAVDLLLQRENNKMVARWDAPPDIHDSLGEEDFGPFAKESFWGGQNLSSDDLLISNPYVRFLLFSGWRGEYAAINDIAIYDFDPKLPKKGTPMSGKAKLEEDGRNLSLVISSILQNEKRKQSFVNLLSSFLPSISGVAVKKLIDRSVMFTVEENYDRAKIELPGAFASDGTVRLAEMILALYFEGDDPTVIEEPERNIHPKQIARLVEMFIEVSRTKQLFITTHNPEVVRNVPISDLILVQRDQSGFSVVSRPSDNIAVREFLEQEIGIDELYVQGLLGP